MTETSIRAGFRFVAGFMLLIIGGQVLQVLSALAQGQLGLLGLVWLAATVFLCWSIYAGRLWARNVLALLTLVGLFGQVMQIALAFGGGQPGVGLFLIAVTLLNVAAVCALYMYGPVQDYFRYIGGDT